MDQKYGVPDDGQSFPITLNLLDNLVCRDRTPHKIEQLVV